ncbi:DUF6804 family protein [Chloroflexota bacterium]
MKDKPHVIPAVIAAIMLLIAVAPLPYGYYTFLRLAICGISIYIAVKAYQWNTVWAIWVFGAIAALFNPIIPIHLTKEIWQPIDLITAIIFGLSLLLLKEPSLDEEREVK